MIALVGWPSDRPYTYDAHVGLRLNRRRLQAMAGLQAWRGFAAAMTGRPHRDLVDAMVAEEDQVAGMIGRLEADRATAEAMARK